MRISHFTKNTTRTKLSPQDMGLEFTSFQRIELLGEELKIASGDEELCLVILNGSLRYVYQGNEGQADAYDTLYLPRQTCIALYSASAAVARYGAPCNRKTTFAQIKFKDVDENHELHKVYGKAEEGTLRDVWNIIDNRFDSSRFLVGICHGSPGGWTAWPPHKHGEKREEVYLYLNMNGGFAIQCVYESLSAPALVAVVQEGDFIAIPEGYHPNVGSPKTGIRYVFCMVSKNEDDRDFMDLHIQSLFGDKLE